MKKFWLWHAMSVPSNIPNRNKKKKMKQGFQTAARDGVVSFCCVAVGSRWPRAEQKNKSCWQADIAQPADESRGGQARRGKARFGTFARFWLCFER